MLTGLPSEVYRSLELGGPLSLWRPARDAEPLSAIRLEIRELIERLDHSIEFLSDIFVARLHRVAAFWWTRSSTVRRSSIA